jgi:hypothetical protein
MGLLPEVADSGLVFHGGFGQSQMVRWVVEPCCCWRHCFEFTVLAASAGEIVGSWLQSPLLFDSSSF